MNPTAQTLYEVCDNTWPARRQVTHGPWILRDGDCGGKRVSAATAIAAVRPEHIAEAEDGMAGLGQAPLFMLRETDDAMDCLLADKGYEIVDPVAMYAAPIDYLTDQPIPPVTAFSIWEPLAIMKEIWAKGGIGPARLRVMARAENKTGILSRWNEKPAGVAFAAIHHQICMVHAVEVLSSHRRQGVAAWMMRKVAFWAADQGATHVSVLCTFANGPANALYSKLGFEAVGRYHYRHKTKGQT